MDMSKLTQSILATIAGAVLATTAAAQDFEPQYVGGYPTEDTAQAAFDEYDYQAATQFYIWGYAYLNSIGLDKGYAAMGGSRYANYIFDKRIQPQHQILTANGEVIYFGSRALNVADGPVVFEIPPRSRGHFWDLGMRALGDTGDIGLDGGKGGKYLLVARDYDGPVPDGYHVYRSPYSDFVMYIGRTFPKGEGSVEKAVELAQTARWYPLSKAGSPPAHEAILIGNQRFSQEWPRDATAFDWLGKALVDDRPPAEGLAHLGNMRQLGLSPGESWKPGARARKILERAARAGEAIVLSMAYRNRNVVMMYDDRAWEAPWRNKNQRFLPKSEDGQVTHEEVEERAGLWHQIVGNFMVQNAAKPGAGQFPLGAYKDNKGEMLNGSHTYRLRIPAKVPVTQFWQVPIYSTKTRAFVETDQRRATLSSTDPGLVSNDDGTIDLWFAPKRPEGVSEKNWVKTNPDEGWFTFMRLYGPLEPILERTWKPNDIERVK